jgi:F0F1-type ATP synthase membrane subunit b/b'
MIKLPDVTVIYVLICFTIAYAILKRYLFSPLGGILDQREREEREAARLHTENLGRLQKALAEAEQGLSLARREALKAREELRGEGRSRLEALLSQASAAATASIEGASREIEEKSQKLSRELPEQSEGLARTLAEKILGRKLVA